MGSSSHPFNPTQIKNGRIVRLRKDGTVKADLGPWIPGQNKIKTVQTNTKKDK